MEQSNELKRLLAEKRELEHRIHLLETGALVRDSVKIDRIGYAGLYQRGKWALFYKYAFIANTGRNGVPEDRTKWQVMTSADSMEEVVNRIPDVIKALQELYEEAKSHGTDT